MNMVRRKLKMQPARALAIEAARLAEERHATDVVVLDLRGISPVTDYFVIFTGTSDRQMGSVAEEIMGKARLYGYRPMDTASLKSSRWVLLDFVDVVVHAFDQVHRKFYDLELIWGDSPRVRWKSTRRKAKS
jgi:ribosome-associated protein